MTGDSLECPACGTDNPAGGRFCTTCGKQLESRAAPSDEQSEIRTEADGPRRRFSWPIAISLLVSLAIAGAGIGYFAGSMDGNDGGPNGGTGGKADTPPDPTTSLPKVLCRVGEFENFKLTLTSQPRECEVLSKGAPIDADSTGTAVALDLDWVEWGPEGARANGNFFVSSAGPRPVTVRLSNPKVVCGSLVFTEFSATPADAQAPTGRSLSIEGCLPGNEPAETDVHLPLPGGTECGSVAFQPGTDSMASDIKAKGIECEQVRSWLSPGNRIPDSWDCSAEDRTQGDRWNEMSHSHVSCTSPDGSASLVFASS